MMRWGLCRLASIRARGPSAQVCDSLDKFCDSVRKFDDYIQLGVSYVGMDDL